MNTARLSVCQLLRIGENAMKQFAGLDWDLYLRSRHEAALMEDLLRECDSRRAQNAEKCPICRRAIIHSDDCRLAAAIEWTF